MANLEYYLHDEADALRIEIEGDLTGAGVGSIEHALQTAKSILAGRPMVVALTAVAKADAGGRGLLLTWHRRGPRIIARSMDSRMFAENILGVTVPMPLAKSVGGSGSVFSSDAGLLPPAKRAHADKCSALSQPRPTNEEFKACSRRLWLATCVLSQVDVRKNDMPDKPELQLITNSRNGDREAMAELFRRHHSLCISTARRILPVRDESSDAVQSAYLSAFRNFTSFRGDSSFKTWITRIVINQCLMHVRNSRGPRHLVSLDDSDSRFGPSVVRDMAPTPEELMQRAEVRKILVETAATLPQRLRETFRLCAISELSIKETAKVLGLTVSATKTHLFRARTLMRSALKDIRHKANGTARQRTIAYTPAVLKKAS